MLQTNILYNIIYMILYVLLFVSSIILYSMILDTIYYNNEQFMIVNNNIIQKNIILLGDSILKNNAYVSPNYNIEILLKKQTIDNIYCFAKDNANIKSIYKQLSTIPKKLNTRNSIIFISVGGNDLLETNSNIEPIFQYYTSLITNIQSTFYYCKIVLLNLYIPPNISNNMRIKINHWNNLINNYSTKNNIITLPLNTILYAQTDFVSIYEPSEVGGMKIVKEIIKMKI